MTGTGFWRAAGLAALALSVAGCSQRQTASTSIMNVSHSAAERDCVARAMYFESHRGSDDGMLAVGTVVANRLKSGRYGSSYCDVVAQKGQFAPGVMTRSMDDSGAERARRVAESVLKGKRHPAVRNAMFFHTAGLRFRYPNMHYVAVAGGNAFYEKRNSSVPGAARENARSRALALALARANPTGPAAPIVVASSGAAPEPASEPVPVRVAMNAAPVQRPEIAEAPASTGSVRVPAPAPRPADAVSAVQQVAAAKPAPKTLRVIDPAVAATPAFASATPAGIGSAPVPAQSSSASAAGSSRFDDAFGSFGAR